MRRGQIIAILLLFCAWAYAQDIEISGAGEIINAGVEAFNNDAPEVPNDAVKPLNDTTNSSNDATITNEGVKEKKTSKGLLFFYRCGNWVDNYLRKDIDTNYIDLPEHSWRLAFTAGSLGVNSTITSTAYYPEPLGTLHVTLLNKTIPSMDLGFNAAYRGFGFGYSWDLLHAYSQRLNFSFGSKFIGLDFNIQTSTNINTRLAINDNPVNGINENNAVVITNANLSIWYALNAAHYSHNAAIKQSYIQKKSAGSLLLFASYMYSHIQLKDTLTVPNADRPTFPSLMSGMIGIQTRQIAVGLGYGINYTPNHGKVILHASAAAMLVTYSLNHISYYIPDSLLKELPSGEPMYRIASSSPVHVTGNVRAAISWEINKYIHLSAWATGDHIRFKSVRTANENELTLAEWNWKVQVTLAARLGAGRDRVQRALRSNGLTNEGVKELGKERKKSRLPLWLTDYFWSPK